VFESAVRGAPPGDFIASYTDAIPGIDVKLAGIDRRQTYKHLKREMRNLGFYSRVNCARSACR
jgi:hypothetical protein